MMPKNSTHTALAAALALAAAGLGHEVLPRDKDRDDAGEIQLGSRPYALVRDMGDSLLKRELEHCLNGKARRSEFSIGHRGAPLRFPEHTEESYVAAARQGAGILECDVTFTRDGTLVCRHSECDLHRTTDILLRDDIANQCSEPFVPADLSPTGKATARCCTSDIDIGQYRRLKGRMAGADRAATSVEQYVIGSLPTADRHAPRHDFDGKLMTHAESIKLFDALGVKFMPELKSPINQDRLDSIFGSQAGYAQRLIDEYEDAGISPQRVWVQSFNPADIEYWIENEPRFGDRAVYLDGRYNDVAAYFDDPDKLEPTLQQIADTGVNIIAAPMWVLLTVRDNGEIAPSPYANAAKRAGLDIITWTLERSDLSGGSATGGWYWKFDNNPNGRAIRTDGDMYEALHVLAKQVGIRGIFSDWPATVTYYANCMGFE